MRRAAALLLVTGTLVLAGCNDPAGFACTTAAQCVHQGSTGTCEGTGFCSFPDPECPGSGRRYGRWAGGGLAGVCVHACGTVGLACCGGDTCESPLTCVAGTCFAGCGDHGQPCCDLAPYCRAGAMCECPQGTCECRRNW